MLGSWHDGARRATAVLAVVGLLALTACSGDSEEPDASASSSGSSAGPSASASTSASPSTEGTSDQEQLAPDEPKAPKARNTAASRKAFAEFVMDSWAYALSTNKASAVTSLSARGQQCEGCRDLTKELAERKKDGWFVDFPGVEVDKVTLTSLSSAPGVWAATAEVDIPASRSYFDDGSYRNDNDAHRNTPFVVTMRLAGPRFVLLAFQVG